MQLNLDHLKELVLPVKVNSETPEYYAALFKKCESLYKERESLLEKIFFKDRLLFNTEALKATRSIEELVAELEDLKNNLTYWQTKFERQFSKEIIQTIINMLSSQVELSSSELIIT